jgi:hypothetical protein
MAFGISATALAIGGSLIGSAAIGAYSSSRASAAQSQAAGEATQAQRDISAQQMDIQSQTADKQLALQREQYLKQLELNEPFRQGGLTGQNMLLAQLQGGPYASAKFGGVPGYDPASAMRNFGASDFQADPGYAFRLSEGMKALDRSAAARGGLISGSALKGAQRYGQDLGSQEYQNAFNRYQTTRTNTLNPFASLSGLAQSSANTLTTAAGNLGGQIGSNIIGAGNAAAAGQVGQANAISQGVGQGINFYQGQQYLNRLPNYNVNTQYGPPTSAMMPYEG